MIKGIFPALLTPFSHDDSIDYKKMEEHIEFLISKKVHGLFLLGTTGEGMLMTIDERKKVTKFVLDIVNDRIPTIVHIGEQRLNDTITLAKHAENNKAYGISSITPYFFPATDEMIYKHYSTILDSISSDFPFYIYNNPKNARNEVTYDTLISLISNYSNIKGIKNSPNDFQQVIYLVDNLSENIDVMIGPEEFFYAGLCSGTSGNISGIANVYPELYVKTFEYISNKDFIKAKRCQGLINKATSILLNDISYLKNGLEFRGLHSSRVRKPFLDISEIKKENLFENLRELEWEINNLDEGILG